MGIVTVKQTDKIGELSQTFSALANMPFVSQPESIDGITEEWFVMQRDRIEEKINEMKKSYPAYAVIHKVKELNERIEHLRKFTADVISYRAKQQINDSVRPYDDDLSQREQESLQSYDDLVDHLLAKSKYNRDIARQNELVLKSARRKKYV